MIEAIGRLMEHDTAGDPVSGIKWTRRTTEKVADELGSAGIEVCPNTVAKLLKGLGYRLRANAKKLNRQKDPGRDAQFAYIASHARVLRPGGLAGRERRQQAPGAGRRLQEPRRDLGQGADRW